MATVTRENIGLLNDKLTVKVGKEDYLPPFEKALKQYAKSAQLPGFRKGMVPAGVIKKMHGPAVYTEEVLRSIEKQLLDYLEQEKLDIFAQPLPGEDNDAGNLDMNNPSEYSFNFEIGLKPAFELPDLSKVSSLTRYKIEVTEAMIDEEVDRLRVRQGKMTEPESIATDEDLLNVKFEESDAEGNLVENGLTKDNSLLLKYFSPALREQLIGKKKDDHVVLQLETAFEDKEREWMISDLGLDKENPGGSLEKFFKMTITKIGLVEKHELNEEFYEKVYPGQEIKTEVDFRNKIKADIQSGFDAESRSHFHHDLYHVLLDNTIVDFPEGFLKKWVEKSSEQPKTPEQVEEEFPSFKNQLKWSLITDKIILDNKIEVSPEEIQEQITKEVMGYFGASGLDDTNGWISNYVAQLLKDKRQVDNAYRKIITEKVFAHEETKTTPVEQSISLDDFKKMIEAHQHHHH